MRKETKTLKTLFEDSLEKSKNTASETKKYEIKYTNEEIYSQENRQTLWFGN